MFTASGLQFDHNKTSFFISFTAFFFVQLAIIDYDYVRFLCYAIPICYKFDSIQSTFSFATLQPILNFLLPIYLKNRLVSSHFFFVFIFMILLVLVLMCGGRVCVCYFFTLLNFLRLYPLSNAHSFHIDDSYMKWIYTMFYITGSCFNA